MMAIDKIHPILVVAEHAGGKLKQVTRELLTCAGELRRVISANIVVAVLGDDIKGLAFEVAKDTGSLVIGLQSPFLESYSSETHISALERLVKELQPSHVCIAHTSQGLDFACALSVRVGAACITGVEGVLEQEGALCFSRAIYNGKVASRMASKAETTILTVQPGLFKPNGFGDKGPGKVEVRDIHCKSGNIKPLGTVADRVDTGALMDARVVVSAGRGIGDKENLDLIYELSRMFQKSAVCGSRPLCDLGWLEYRQQVGVTGATIAPDLYIACGISGAVQHVSGMRGSGFIVAINTDPGAAIFSIADVCIQEDLVMFIPALVEARERESL